MDSTGDVTKVLVEKFHPDMKMLSNPSYSLYEVHQNKGKIYTVLQFFLAVKISPFLPTLFLILLT